jgi:hypothetical protein
MNNIIIIVGRLGSPLILKVLIYFTGGWAKIKGILFV